MTVKGLIELLEPYKDNVNHINGDSAEFDAIEINVAHGVVWIDKFKVRYMCDRCTELTSDNIEVVDFSDDE